MQKYWRAIVLAVCYIVAGILLLVAALQLVTGQPARSAVLFSGIGFLLAFGGWRLLSDATRPGASRAVALLVCYAVGGGLVLAGISLVTPSGPARQFVAFAGAGILIALLGWAFLSERPFSLSLSAAAETPQERDTRWTRDTMLMFSYVGVAGLVLYAIRTVVPAGPVQFLFQIIGGGVILSCSSLLAGLLLGFLFGIPRALVPVGSDAAASPGSGPDATAAPGGARRDRTAFQVNTNLEQISDWLTKIIVGLGLINLAKFPRYFTELGSYFGAIFGDVPARDSLALALILLFAICGFLLGYLLTRLFLTRAFQRVETPEEELDRLVKKAGQRPAAPVAAGAERSAAVDPNQLATAQRVAEVAAEVDQSQLRRQVSSLANEYVTTRARMPYSPERTRQLESIVARMRAISLASYSMLDELTASPNPGERLAAIVFLQMRPHPKWLKWLGDRFGSEKPFTMYHAALALRAAADSLGPEHRDTLRSSILDAKQKLPAEEKDTHRVLDEALVLLGDK